MTLLVRFSCFYGFTMFTSNPPFDSKLQQPIIMTHNSLHLYLSDPQYIYMRPNTQITSRYEIKSNEFSPKKKHYDLECRVIQKKVSNALAINKTKHTIKPKNILFTSQHAPLKKDIDYEFLSTYRSNLSTRCKRIPSAFERTIRQVISKSSGFKSRCQSAFSRTQTLKNTTQQREPSMLFRSVGVLMQEKGRKGQQVYSLNLLRIHGFSQKKIRINNFMF